MGKKNNERFSDVLATADVGELETNVRGPTAEAALVIPLVAKQPILFYHFYNMFYAGSLQLNPQNVGSIKLKRLTNASENYAKVPAAGGMRVGTRMADGNCLTLVNNNGVFPIENELRTGEGFSLDERIDGADRPYKLVPGQNQQISNKAFRPAEYKGGTPDLLKNSAWCPWGRTIKERDCHRPNDVEPPLVYHTATSENGGETATTDEISDNQYYNYSALGGIKKKRERRGQSPNILLAYANDDGNNADVTPAMKGANHKLSKEFGNGTFQAQTDILWHIARETGVDPACWDMASRNRIYDQLLNLQLGIRDDCDPKSSQNMQVKRGRTLKELDDFIRDYMANLSASGTGAAEITDNFVNLGAVGQCGGGANLHLFVNVRVRIDAPGVQNVVLRIRYPIRMRRGEVIGGIRVKSSTARGRAAAAAQRQLCNTLTAQNSKNITNASLIILVSSLLNMDCDKLSLGDNNISDIGPLSNLTGLTVLDLGLNTQLSDITPLSNLTGLIELRLGENIISDIRPLSKLTGLTVFHLAYNTISDLAPLSNLTGLTELQLGENNISDIRPLSKLTGLTDLHLGYTNISNIVPLSNLTGLTDLHLMVNKISDITPLSKLTGLTDLYLGLNTQLSDITPLSKLTGLTDLRLGDNNISNIGPLSNLTGLTDLHLVANKISDITPLSKLTGLTDLYLGLNIISDITPLSKLTGLTDLRLAENIISDIRPLSKLTGLTNLQLMVNKISDITPLSKLTGLTGLYLDLNTQLSDITPLSNLTGLTDLRLAQNNISDIRPLSNLTGLTDLHLMVNNISDIRPLSNLTGLTGLHLWRNNILNIGPLSNLTGLTKLDLRDNPADQADIDTLPTEVQKAIITNPS